MDPFTEKEIVDCLKSIAVSLRNIDRKLDDLTTAVRENGLGLDPNEDDEDLEELEELEDEELKEAVEDLPLVKPKKITDGFNPMPDDPSELEDDEDDDLEETSTSEEFQETKIIIEQDDSPEENSAEFF